MYIYIRMKKELHAATNIDSVHEVNFLVGIGYINFKIIVFDI